MCAYYNENDPKAAAWLRELIKANLIADGEVDDRSIEDVQPSDLAGFVQCHFFAGIGGWSYALRLAGWPDDRAVWTGSCPCQPWSAAGSGLGADDSRDLWPAWFRLICECRPATVFGEQVASAPGFAWLDRVCAHMEGENYAIGAVDLPAACVHAPHCRQRLWFVADSIAERYERERLSVQQRETPHDFAEVVWGCALGAVGHANGARLQERERNGGLQSSTLEPRTRQAPERRSDIGDFWRDTDLLECRDGKVRPVEPSTFPLAHGLPARVGRLRGYGNAIVPAVAAEVIKAYIDICEER